MSYSKKIENDLRNKIQNGFYPKGSLIPKQTELSSYYNISRVTIQKVLENLKIEGYLQSKTGVGTLVREDFSPLDCKVEEFGGTTKRYGKFGKITSQIISFEKRPVELFEQEKLRLKGTGIVYDLIRLRLLNDEPFSLEYTIMPTQTIPGITEKVLEKSIYQYIEIELELKVGFAMRRFHADKADAYDVKYLKTKVDDPIFEVEQVVYLQNGQPFEYSQSRHCYDKGDYLVTEYR